MRDQKGRYQSCCISIHIHKCVNIYIRICDNFLPQFKSGICLMNPKPMTTNKKKHSSSSKKTIMGYSIVLTIKRESLPVGLVIYHPCVRPTIKYAKRRVCFHQYRKKTGCEPHYKKKCWKFIKQTQTYLSGVYIDINTNLNLWEYKIVLSHSTAPLKWSDGLAMKPLGLYQYKCSQWWKMWRTIDLLLYFISLVI